MGGDDSTSIMPTHPFKPISGEIKTLTIESDALKGNLCGDPHTRSVDVYLPSGWQEMDNLPLLVDLVGFTGSGPAHLNWKPFAESLPQRVERLVDEGKMGPVALAFPDCFTSLGGNQYINSEATGNWATFLIDEMIPVIEKEFSVGGAPERRGVFGKSSGGYGAIAHGMLYADTWGAIAVHSGDMGWDRLFMGDFPKAVTSIEKHGGYDGFLEHIADGKKVKGEDFHTLMIIAMGASYDPDSNNPKGVSLPVDLRTSVLDMDAWSRWLLHDPVVMVEREDVQYNLRKLKGIFLDCGSKDQYNIHFGTRQLSDRLNELEINHIHEEFDDTHSSIDYRMDVSLPFLYSALLG